MLRAQIQYLAAGALVLPVLGAVDGERGLLGGGVAWVVCWVPLARWAPRRVADGAAGSTIAGKWRGFQTGRMLFRLTWVLGVGALLYQLFGDDLGPGFWIALIVFYQVMLALSVIGALGATAPVGRPTTDGVLTSDDSGGRL